jgi:hypothetical protein
VGGDAFPLLRDCVELTAQFRQNRRKQKGPALLQALDCLVAGAGFEPATFGL